MRIPEPNEDLIGKICVCSVGRPAIITSNNYEFNFKDGKGYSCYVGLGLDGKGTWASTSPCVIAENAQEFHDKLLDRFGGKMSFNS